ncbi:MAG: NAD(P)/FAD-dependent oxidoreductase [Bacillota bacterium]
MRTDYDVILIGAGPAGIFAALELSARHPELRVAILERGADINRRRCPISGTGRSCLRCKPCSIVYGWGGAGAFSDGKLTLTTEFGGILDQYIDQEELAKLISEVDRVYLDFGAPDTVFGTNAATRDLQRQAATADLHFIPATIRHMGTETCYRVLEGMRQHLEGRVEVHTESPVARIEERDGAVTGVTLESGQALTASYVVAAPGRGGAEWFAREGARLDLGLENNPVDIGVRVEVPAVVMAHLTDAVYESKFLYYTRAFDDMVRTFCMNPYGEVVVENTDGLKIVNGHSYAERKTENTNFALLVSKTFTEPFREPISYGKYIASLANMLGDGVIVQRLGDLRAGRRTTDRRLQKGGVRPTLVDATPGDLSLVLPYRHLIDILEMLEALDRIAPGINSRYTLLYGVEVKFYSSRPQLSRVLETRISNLFAAGDGAGVTRGLAQASAAGVLVAREILRRTN